jgi:catechol 2,3-dioxygenase-like lactoylglutathione lyase family enzyme
MRITHIDHFNIRTTPQDMRAVRDFYVDVLGLTEGARPPFPFPGYWLYGGAEAAILHIAANATDTDMGAISPEKSTGQMDHISLKCIGMAKAKAKLDALRVPYVEIPVPGWQLGQLFLRDPTGVRVELTFDLEREANLSAAERA